MFLNRPTIIAAAVILLSAANSSGADQALTPSLTVEERYDTNVSFRESNSHDKADFVTTVSPQLHFKSSGRRVELDATYRFGYSMYARDSSLDSPDHLAAAELNAKLAQRLNLLAGDRLRFTQDSLKATDTGIQIERTDILANSVYIGARTQLDETKSVGLTLRQTAVEYDNPSFFDTTTDSLDISGGYRYRSTGTASVAYKFTDFQYEDSENPDIEGHSAVLSLADRLDSSLSLSASAGITYLDFEGGKEYLVGTLGLEREYPASAIGVRYAREVTNPSGLSDTVALHDRVTFDYTIKAARNLELSAFGGIAKNRTEPGRRVDINSYITEIRAGWQARPWMSVGVGLVHFQQWKKDDIGAGLSRDKIYVNVTFTGPEWRF